MAEEWGMVVLKVPEDIMVALAKAQNSDAQSVVIQLGAVAGVNATLFDNADCRIGAVTRKDAYLSFDFDCSDWSKLSQLFVSHAIGIEFYFSGEDEYGTTEYFSLNENGKRFAFSFDQGGDAWDQDGYEEKVVAKLDEWKLTLPAAVRAAYPGFSDTSGLIFGGP